MQAAADASPDAWTAFQRCFHVYLDGVLRPDRCRILFQDAPAVLGMKSVDILMDSGFGEMVADIQALIDAGTLAAQDAEALGHLLNGATINLAFWAAEGEVAHDRPARAHASLDGLLQSLRRKP
jgi:hypothetical protein